MKNNLTDVLVLGTKSWNDKSLLKFVRKNEKLNVAFCAEQTQVNDSELYNTFLGAYKAKYGDSKEPSGSAAAAFDAYIMAVKAIEDAYNKMAASDVEELVKQAKSDAEGKAIRDAYNKTMEEGIPDGSHIREALSKITEFKGASGLINYNGNNEPSKSIAINHIQAGKDMPVYVVK